MCHGAGIQVAGCLSLKCKPSKASKLFANAATSIRTLAPQVCGTLPEYGCGSKLNRRGKPQVLVHVSTYRGNPFWNSGFLSHSHIGMVVRRDETSGHGEQSGKVPQPQWPALTIARFSHGLSNLLASLKNRPGTGLFLQGLA